MISFRAGLTDRCKSSPCRNGRTCREEENQSKRYSCQCPPQYTGTYCEVSTGLCNIIIFCFNVVIVRLCLECMGGELKKAGRHI